MSEDLEEDFEELSKKVNAELAKAAKAIKKAILLTEEAGLGRALEVNLYRFEDMDAEDRERHEEFDEWLDLNLLTNALAHAGWSISSMRC